MYTKLPSRRAHHQRLTLLQLQDIVQTKVDGYTGKTKNAQVMVGRKPLCRAVWLLVVWLCSASSDAPDGLVAAGLHDGILSPANRSVDEASWLKSIDTWGQYSTYSECYRSISLPRERNKVWPVRDLVTLHVSYHFSVVFSLVGLFGLPRWPGSLEKNIGCTKASSFSISFRGKTCITKVLPGEQVSRLTAWVGGFWIIQVLLSVGRDIL